MMARLFLILIAWPFRPQRAPTATNARPAKMHLQERTSMADLEQRIDEATGTATVGHEWDGIEELDTPDAALVALHPLRDDRLRAGLCRPLSGHSDARTARPGRLGWSSHGQLATGNRGRCKKRKRADDACHRRNPDRALCPRSPKLMQAAEQGRSARRSGSIASSATARAPRVSKGYPSLNDDDWLWGGDIKAIHRIYGHPRHPTSGPQARPACQPDARLRPRRHSRSRLRSAMSSVFVRAISRQEQASASSPARRGVVRGQLRGLSRRRGGKGERPFGAPNLTDAHLALWR